MDTYTTRTGYEGLWEYHDENNGYALSAVVKPDGIKNRFSRGIFFKDLSEFFVNLATERKTSENPIGSLAQTLKKIDKKIKMESKREGKLAGLDFIIALVTYKNLILFGSGGLNCIALKNGEVKELVSARERNTNKLGKLDQNFRTGLLKESLPLPEGFRIVLGGENILKNTKVSELDYLSKLNARQLSHRLKGGAKEPVISLVS